MDRRPPDIDTYLESLPDDQRTALEDLKRTLRAIAPDAVEGMGYGMPALKYRGRPLVYFAAAKNHCALYGPAVAGYKGDLTGYLTSKGTIRFLPDKPLPEPLLRKIVSARMAAIDSAAERDRPRRSSRAD